MRFRSSYSPSTPPPTSAPSEPPSSQPPPKRQSTVRYRRLSEVDRPGPKRPSDPRPFADPQAVQRWLDETESLAEKQAHLPLKPLLENADALAERCEKLANETRDDLRPGKVSPPPSVFHDTAHTLRTLCNSVDKVHARYVTLLSMALAPATLEDADALFDEADAALEDLQAALGFILRDGHHPDNDARLAQLRALSQETDSARALPLRWRSSRKRTEQQRPIRRQSAAPKNDSPPFASTQTGNDGPLQLRLAARLTQYAKLAELHASELSLIDCNPDLAKRALVLAHRLVQLRLLPETTLAERRRKTLIQRNHLIRSLLRHLREARRLVNCFP